MISLRRAEVSSDPEPGEWDVGVGDPDNVFMP